MEKGSVFEPTDPPALPPPAVCPATVPPASPPCWENDPAPRPPPCENEGAARDCPNPSPAASEEPSVPDWPACASNWESRSGPPVIPNRPPRGLLPVPERSLWPVPEKDPTPGIPLRVTIGGTLERFSAIVFP